MSMPATYVSIESDPRARIKVGYSGKKATELCSSTR